MRRVNLLIVDDSDLIADRIMELLKDADEVSIIGHARSNSEANKLLRLQVPDVILLDINMGTDSGLDLLKTVKIMYPNIMIIMLTNYTDPQYVTLCKKFGAEYFFDKSREFEYILPTLKEIAEQKKN